MLSKNGYHKVLEIGPGTGALTKYLLPDKSIDLHVVEVDGESVEFLLKKFPQLKDKIFKKNFLEFDFNSLPFGVGGVGLIGNFPYNISSQILFKVYEQREKIPELVGMFQKEVAQRIASPPGSRDYGILSVLMQAFYNIEYLFTVNENVFSPPPKVKSAVIRLKRNNVKKLNCDELLFKTVVKTGFNQRRKTLRNALRVLLEKRGITGTGEVEIFKKRAEQLSVNDFVNLTKWIEEA